MILTDEEKEYYEKVIVLNCGGTIDMNKQRSATSNAVQSTMPKIINWLQDHNVHFEYSNAFERSLDSSNIGNKEWDILYEKIKNIISKKRIIKEKLRKSTTFPSRLCVGGIVISHGTDTLQLTSLVISLRLSLEEIFFPIIFTGSFTTIDDPENDIYNNLVKSIYASKGFNVNDRKRVPPQIYALIGEEIHLASRTTKVYTTQNEEGKYFFSYPFPVAKITSKPEIKHNTKKFDITIKFDDVYFDFLTNSNSTNSWRLAKQYVCENKEWAKVEHILINPNTSSNVLKDYLKRVIIHHSTNNSTRFGVIIQGNFSQREDFDKLGEDLRFISNRYDVIILVGSKEVYEKLALFNVVNLDYIHKSLSHAKARVKLSWLLKLNLEDEQITKFMKENTTGEIAEADKFPDWIQYETFGEQGEMIPIYPNIEHEVFEHAIERAIETNKKSVFMYGFGNGHIPTIRESIGNVVSKFINNLQISKLENLNLYDSNDLDEILIMLEDYIKKFRFEFQNLLTSNYIFYGYKHKTKSISENNVGEFIIACPELVAKRLIKDALMSNSKILRVIGLAIDEGVKFYIKTTTLKAKTNHSDYPVGRTLLAIGVHSDLKEGWNSRYFKQK